MTPCAKCAPASTANVGFEEEFSRIVGAHFGDSGTAKLHNLVLVNPIDDGRSRLVLNSNEAHYPQLRAGCLEPNAGEGHSAPFKHILR